MGLVKNMNLLKCACNWLSRHKKSHEVIYDHAGNRHDVYISWSRTDHKYIAEIPDFLGCMADATTKQEIIANSVCAANEWIDAAKSIGRDIP